MCITFFAPNLTATEFLVIMPNRVGGRERGRRATFYKKWRKNFSERGFGVILVGSVAVGWALLCRDFGRADERHSRLSSGTATLPTLTKKVCFDVGLMFG